MNLPDVNLIAVVIAAVVNMGIGFLWYSPMLFSNQWVKAMGFNMEELKKKQKEMGPLYGLSLLGAVVMAYVFGGVKEMTGTMDMTQTLSLAFMLWLGFVAPVQMTDVIFGGRKKEVFFINTGYQLAAMLAMAVVFSLLG